MKILKNSMNIELRIQNWMYLCKYVIYFYYCKVYPNNFILIQHSHDKHVEAIFLPHS